MECSELFTFSTNLSSPEVKMWTGLNSRLYLDADISTNFLVLIQLLTYLGLRLSFVDEKIGYSAIAAMLLCPFCQISD